MLDENKEIYKQSASLIKGWEHMDRNDLCNEYIELKERGDPKTDSYLGAIIIKFWDKMVKQYYSQPIRIFNEEDCYDWMIESILYILDKHVWTDPESSLYEDPKGPEKALSVKSKSLMKNFIVYANRQKRRVNIDTDNHYDNEEMDTVPYEDEYDVYKEYFKMMFNKYFDNKDYLSAFVLDAILNENVFVSEDSEEGTKKLVFNNKSLVKYLNSLDAQKCMVISNFYNIPYEEVMESLKYISYTKKLKERVENIIFLWSKSKEFIDYLKG